MESGKYQTKCTFPANIFGNSKYYVNVDVVCPKKEHHVLTKILEFKVDFLGYNPAIQYGGNNLAFFMWPKLSWAVSKIDDFKA